MIPLPELLLPLPSSTLRTLLTTLGPVPSAPISASDVDLVRWLFTHPACSPSSFSSPSASSAPASHRLPRALLEALSSTIPSLGTRAGVRALCEAARAAGDPRVAEWSQITSAEPAIDLILEAASSKKSAVRTKARLLLDLASLRTARNLPPRATYELLGSHPIERDPKRIEAALRRALGKKVEEIWSVVDRDGTVRLAIFVRRPLEATFELSARARKEAARASQGKLACDHVCIAADGSRLRVTPSIPETLPEYVSAFDLSLNPSSTLRPLLDSLHDRLNAARIPPVTNIDIVGLRVRRPDGRRSEVRGAKLVDPSYKLPPGGYVDRATIRITVNGTRTADAFLQLPHHFDISNRTFEGEMRAVLDALGLFTPGKLPDDSRSLAPYEHGEWRWVAVIGEAAFARLKALHFFTQVKAAHVVTKEMRMHGAAYVVHEVPGHANTWYALAEDPSLGARLVKAEDRMAYRLDTSKLREAMMRDIGAVPAELLLELPGILDLGVVTLASGRLRFVYAMGEPPPGWAEALRRACGIKVTPVVFVPRGHAGAIPGMLEIELDVQEQFGARGAGRALGRAAEALHVEAEVDPWRLHDEELILSIQQRRFWLHGLPLPLGDRPYECLAILARDPGRPHFSKDIGAKIAPSGSPDVTARKAKAEAERQIRKALDDAGLDGDLAEKLIVADGRNGYRLGVSVRVVE